MKGRAAVTGAAVTAAAVRPVQELPIGKCSE